MKIFVKVKPLARQNGIEKVNENEYFVSVNAAPDKGKANEAVIKILADYFKVRQSQVTLVSGEKFKRKTFEISS